jgi:DNA-directed RNA polymerase
MQTNTPELKQAQLTLEEEALGMGIEKYRKELEKGQGELPPGLTLIRKAIEPLSQRLDADMEEALSGRPGRDVSMYMYLSQFDTDLIAFVTAKTVINGLGRQDPLTHCASTISKALEDTINFEKLRAEAPALYRQLMKKIERTAHSGHRHLVMKKQMQFAKVASIKWGRADVIRVGTYLIHMLAEATGLIEIVQQSRGTKDTPYFIKATEETLAWLEKSHARCELLAPVYMPMVHQPKQWSSPFNGGYLTKPLQFPIMKTGNRNFLEELKQWEMPMVYEAINALQNTPWSVNKPILRVLKEVWDGGGKLGGLPSREPLELPPMHFNPDTDKEALKAWKTEAAKVYEQNLRLSSKRIAIQQKLWMAEKFEKFDQFHFAHALDWRGRAYPVASLLNPQGDDVAKALLTFSEGKPLGDNGAYWLAVHGANTFGIDKVSFAERVQWVEDNTDMILECAANPLDGSRRWAEADSPYMFLAFCYEWLAFHAHCYSLENDSSTFVSNLPVSWDGSCNGLQNFSAMLRDEIGGKATNLIPSDTPADIYSEVKRVAQAAIDKEAAEGNPQAQRWVGRLTRQLVKRNTMTVPYAVSRFGMKNQIAEEFKKLIEEGDAEGCDLRNNYTFEDAGFVAEHNHAAIGSVVVAARHAMEWLREAAKVAASNALPIRWVTPSGLMVLQNYRTQEGKQTNFTVAGHRYQLVLRYDTDKLDTRKQSLGISPNFVHSLDAAHMMRTVSYCLEHGVTSYSMIHDSYGTHAADAETLSRQLRQAFVDQYTPNVLEDFRDQLAQQLPPELAQQLPELPPMGTLDLTGIMDSEYFFA